MISVGFIVLILAVIAAIIFVFFANSEVGTPPLDPSYALIASPLNGDILFAGDPVYVEADFMLAHRNIAGLELYVDGSRYVLDELAQPYSGQSPAKCPSDDPTVCGLLAMRTLWIPTEPGAHTLSACMSGDQSQGAEWIACSDDIKVMVIDLMDPPASAGTYLPQPGDTLESVAQKFGLPPLLVAAGNPGIEPVAALPADIPVNVPADPFLAVPADGGATGSPWTVEKVVMTVDLAVDKVYCYYSLGENYWTRMPAVPQGFIYPLAGYLDLSVQFRAMVIPPAGGPLALECWGWTGAALVPLGSGETDLGSPASKTIQLRGEHFVLDADLIVIPDAGETRGPKIIIPPPQGLTRTSNLDVCIKHSPPADFIFSPIACKTAVENGDIILVWEWLAPLFPPDDPMISWLTKIDGYHVYEVNSAGKPTLIKNVSFSNKKVLILKKTWIGPGNFMVRAYAGPLESANSNLYTLGGAASGLATVTIAPSAEVYGGQAKKKEDLGFPASLCSVSLPSILDKIDGSEIVVGFEHYEPGESCLIYYWEYSRAQVIFDLSAVKGPVSSAKLSYRQDFTTSPGQSCARELRTVTTTTTGAAMKDLASDPYAMLSSYGYTGSVFNVDVTDAIRDWMLGTPNAGFLFVGRDEHLPADCGGLFGPGCIGGYSASCWTRYSDVKLTVTYFIK